MLCSAKPQSQIGVNAETPSNSQADIENEVACRKSVYFLARIERENFFNQTSFLFLT